MIIPVLIFGADAPQGFTDIPWGTSSEEARTIIGVNWQRDPVEDEFPGELNVTVFRTNTDVAGYPAGVRYYFCEDRFFQATVFFQFDDLKNYDFNYNVYRSVNEYYTVIRSRTLVFVHQIYDLLRKKYGKKEPIFKGLDPRFAFVKLDAYVKQERWNLRYHPYDFYQRIVTASYARWDFPKTRVIFSVNIAAPEKRFDYQLSLTSLDLERYVNKRKDQLRMQGL